MAIEIGQWSVASSSTAPIFSVPSGPVSMTFWNVGTTNIYIGASSAVTVNNGLQCHSIPTQINTFVGSKGQQLYAANTAASAVFIQYIIATAQ